MLRELAQLASAVERHFGQPQDIEWAVVNGTLSLLQSRPITNLPPAPLKDVRWDAPVPVFPDEVLMRRDVVENMPGPLSPLFAELYVQEGLELAADMEKRPIQQRPFYVTVNGYAYVRIGLARFSSRPRSRKSPQASRMKRLGKKKIRDFMEFIINYYVKWILQWRHKGLPAYLACIEQWRQLDPAAASDEQLLSGVRALTIADVIYWVHTRRVMGVSKVHEYLLNDFLRKHAPESGSMMGVAVDVGVGVGAGAGVGSGEDVGGTGNITARGVSRQMITNGGDSGMFIGGFASKTAQAQADLAAIAKQIRAEEKLYELVIVTPAERLLDTLRQNADGRPVIKEIEQYLDKYGHVVYTLDYAEPTQTEAPLPVLMSLKALVQGSGYDPTARQAELARKREASVKEASKLFGPLQRWKFRWHLWLARYYCRHREEALFFIGAAWAVLRPLALELGRRLVEVGTLASADDVFYLTSEELEEAIQARKEEQALPDYIQKAADQRELREARKRIHPPRTIPPEPDKSFVESFRPWELDAGARLSLTVGGETQILNEEGSDTLKGFPVSRGQVTAEASVIISPADFAKMKPGTILVCQMATSAWTQLFPLAKGLVTDIGGMNAHGSIVAREYGIPAVMGTGNITKRIVSGQRITVDGDAGTVALLDE